VLNTGLSTFKGEKMSRRLIIAFFIAVAALASGCASVTGTTNQSVSLQTRDQQGDDVEGAACELSNAKGKWFVTTPGSVMIQRSNDDMQVLCKKNGLGPGRKAVVSDIKGAMFGNIILGGGVGAIIDHNTGAAYEYPAMIQIVMEALSKAEAPNAPAQVAKGIAPTPTPTPTALPTLVPLAIAKGKAPQAGDEWEYLARDNLFGKQKTLLWRVKTVDSSGVLEELVVDGKANQQWLFSNKADLIGAPIDTGFFFGQHWDGQTLPALKVNGVGNCVQLLRCQVNAKVVGHERITVPAGTFDAVRIDGNLNMKQSALDFSGPVSFWYSEKDRRLLKQTVTIRNSGFNVDETLELQAARTYQ
jgi:hypothetical protein